MSEITEKIGRLIHPKNCTISGVDEPALREPHALALQCCAARLVVTKSVSNVKPRQIDGPEKGDQKYQLQCETYVA